MALPEIVNTDDGSITLRSGIYGETYHSATGAITEAFVKYSEACKIGKIARQGRIRLLDIGFGLGYNILAAIISARKANRACIIEVVSLENDLLPADKIRTLKIPPAFKEEYEIIEALFRDLRYERGGIRIEVMISDARKAVRNMDAPFDAVFLDPFSPRKNPELWTVEFFRELYRMMNKEAILATYSAATPVRCGLIEVGFRIGEGPGDYRKRSGTLASKAGEIKHMSPDKLERLKASPECLPFYDPEMNFTGKEIAEYRESVKKRVHIAS